MKPKRKYKKKTDRQKDIKECDRLWGEIIKIKAGYRSEYSDKPGMQIGGKDVLHPHHLMGKSSLAMRYNFDNGFCLTGGEHFYIAHVAGRKEMFEERIKEVRGKDVFTKLKGIKFKTSTTLSMYHMYLKQELKRLKNGKIY